MCTIIFAYKTVELNLNIYRDRHKANFVLREQTFDFYSDKNSGFRENSRIRFVGNNENIVLLTPARKLFETSVIRFTITLSNTK